MNYYLKKGDGPANEYSLDAIKKGVKDGTITSEFLARRANETNWCPVNVVLEAEEAGGGADGPNSGRGKAIESAVGDHRPSSENIRKAGRNMTLVGGGIGFLLGYPLSYWFQNAALRAKVSLGEYIKHYAEIIEVDELRSSVIAGFVVATLVGALAGFLIALGMKKSK